MIQLIRGFKDILPGEIEVWQQIEKTVVSLFEDFGFKEIRIPIMERTELFARSIGEDTDIVEKEMYTFPDRKGDLITLRPKQQLLFAGPISSTSCMQKILSGNITPLDLCFAGKGLKREDIGNFTRSMLKFWGLIRRWLMWNLFYSW
jgi:ATP phosphoribosyltransferase regulatory subunit HisZ